jgi:branched-chain amino acid transport system ATP-binding protein
MPAFGELTSDAASGAHVASAREPLLCTRGLAAGYGHLAAVRELNMTVHAGEIVVLLAPNGGGKTTILMTLAGWLPPLEGEVLWQGRSTRAPLFKRARMGVSLVTDSRSVFTGLTVAANLKVSRGETERAFELFPELQPLMRRRVGLLSGGEQKILALAMGLASDPKLLLVDELSLGLAPLVVQRLLAALDEARSRGVGIVLVEQHLRKALRVADRGYVLRRGRVALEGTCAELESRIEELRRHYIARGAVSHAGVDGDSGVSSSVDS